LALFGVSMAFLVRARLGLDSWDVLHQGLAERTGLRFGTVSNVIVIGLAVDAALDVMPAPGHMAARWGFLVAGIVVNGVATGLYIGAGLGPGPRDGLMTGLAARGYSIRLARTLIELAVLSLGWLLGGTVGVGTVLYALAIGPLAHYFIPRLTVRTERTQACLAS